MTQPLSSTPAIDALVAAIGQLEAAIPAVSPTSATPDMQGYQNLITGILGLWSPLYNLDQIAKAEAAQAAQ